MTTRRREYSFEPEDYDGILDGAKAVSTKLSRYVPQELGAKFSPPTVYLFFKDDTKGKIRRRKMPVRDFVNSSSDILSTDAIAKNLVKRHPVLECVPLHRITTILNKLRVHHNLPEPAPVNISLSSKSNIAALPSLPQKSRTVPNPTTNSFGNGEDQIRLDGNMDLNKLSDNDLSKIKAEMNDDFEKNRVKPGDPNFKYDIQKTFESANEENDWDTSDSKPTTHPKPFGELETDDDEISAMNEEIAEMLEDLPHTQKTPFLDKPIERDEESGVASKTAFWWMKNDAEEDILKQDVEHAKAPSIFDPKPIQKQPVPEFKRTANDTMNIDSRSNSSDIISGTNVVMKVVEKNTISSKDSEVTDPSTAILKNSGMSATMNALQQAKSLLASTPVASQNNDKTSTAEESTQKKLAPISTLSNLPPVSTFSKPLSQMEKPSPTSASTDKSYATAQSTVLDIDDDIDIDAGFANYDADADADGDFMDLILPKKKEPILPLSAPPSSVSKSNPISFAQSFSPPPPVSAKPQLSTLDKNVELPKNTISVPSTSKPGFIEDEYDLPIDEEFENFDADKESEEDLTFLMKSTKTIPSVSSSIQPEILPNKSTIQSTLSQTAGTESKTPNQTPSSTSLSDPKANVSAKIESTVAIEPSKSSGPLGALPSLTGKSSLGAPNLQTVDLKSAKEAEDDIPEDFDFDVHSISDLLEDTDAPVKHSLKAPPKHTSEISAASIKDKISTIGGSSKSTILDKFAESAMKLLSDDKDVTSKKSAAYDDEFGAGDTDSEGVTSNAVSPIANQSPAFKKKTVNFLPDEDSDLFGGDDVELDTDDGLLDGKDEDDAF